jgi:hypothetical protein
VVPNITARCEQTDTMCVCQRRALPQHAALIRHLGCRR